MRIALDTNVIVYAEGVQRTAQDGPKHGLALRLIGNMANEHMSVSIQALAELHSVLVRRGGLSPARASGRVRLWTSRAEVIATTPALLEQALDLTAAHNLQIFDALILAAAAAADCELLLSEDMHAGFVWRGVTLANPFRPSTDPRLTTLVGGPV